MAIAGKASEPIFEASFLPHWDEPLLGFLTLLASVPGSLREFDFFKTKWKDCFKQESLARE